MRGELDGLERKTRRRGAMIAAEGLHARPLDPEPQP